MSKVLWLDLSKHNFTLSGNPGVLIPCVSLTPQAPAWTTVTLPCASIDYTGSNRLLSAECTELCQDCTVTYWVWANICLKAISRTGYLLSFRSCRDKEPGSLYLYAYHCNSLIIEILQIDISSEFVFWILYLIRHRKSIPRFLNTDLDPRQLMYRMVIFKSLSF